MFRVVQVCITKLASLTYRYCLRQGLTLPPRGGVRNDRLNISHVSQRLDVEWIARDIYPWDFDDTDAAKTVKFLEQFLADTEVAIDRIFQALPQINEIAVTVREPHAGVVIAAGTVERVPVEKQAFSSPRMRLLARGLTCYLDERYCERLPLPDGHMQNA